MHVAVLGGGMQGSLIALALASKGTRVTLIERRGSLMSRAAVNNEGKIHLGFMYGADPSLATARTMIRGALAFAPFLARHVGVDPAQMPSSTPTVYVVHRDGLRSLDDLSGYFGAVHSLILEAAEDRPDAYFGLDLRERPRRWSAAELEREYDGRNAVAALKTPEVSIESAALAEAVRARISAEPLIEQRLNRVVTGVEEDGEKLAVASEGAGGATRDRYEHVVNALWEARLAIDATLGFRPSRPWLHRFRYGLRVRLPLDMRRPPTTTMVVGAFGEVVNCLDGGLYLMWYPASLVGTSDALVPPEWPMPPPEPFRSELLAKTLRGLGGTVLALREVMPEAFSEVSVKGGVIVAWGSSDIDDPRSELHRRFEIGVTSRGRYHSVDPGKLTMTPYFAGICAHRIAP